MTAYSSNFTQACVVCNIYLESIAELKLEFLNDSDGIENFGTGNDLEPDLYTQP